MINFIISSFSIFIYLLGLGVIMKFSIWAYQFAVRQVLRKKKDFKQRYGKNSWACITGATSGIGEAIAIELAKAGLNIILIARSSEKLKAAALRLKGFNQGIQTHCIEADFKKQTDIKFYRELGAKLNNHDVSILVHNVGLKILGDFTDAEDSNLKETIDTNCLSNVMLTKVVIAQMLKRENRSAIIFTPGKAMFHPSPGAAVLSATKRFEDYFSRGIAYEVKDKIDVLSMRTGSVHAKIDPFRNPLPADICARDALRDLGFEIHTSGNIRHDIRASYDSFVSSIIPERLSLEITYQKMKHLKEVVAQAKTKRS